MPAHAATAILDRYRRARERRAPWDSVWQECYDFVLPQRQAARPDGHPGGKSGGRVFDGTAPDAVDQLAASLVSQLTPPGGRWFGLTAGPSVEADSQNSLAAALEQTTEILLSHIDRSNFAVEIHQCYLDLIIAGTACLLFEEAPLGESSAFRFTAVPLAEIAVDENPSGRLDTTFRRSDVPLTAVRERFPAVDRLLQGRHGGHAPLPDTVRVLEAVVPDDGGYRYLAFLDDASVDPAARPPIADGHFRSSPFITFRWLKAPGEIHGRSPVMKALPDIKTANKVVELVLKNASIAVTGIWQADDDGVLNPATIRLVPGTIIPKAVGSAGLTPLEAPGRFDVSEIVLEQLRARIRKALYADQLGSIHGPRMTATEVLERAAEMARLLGATFGRLQSELLTPLLHRAHHILARRGEIPDLPIDGHRVTLEYRSPQARYQAQQDAQATILWLGLLNELGPDAQAVVDRGAAARWLARAFGVPGAILRPPPDLDPAADAAADATV